MKKTSRYNHILKKTITMLCVFVMVFCFLPMNVFAEAVQEQLKVNEDSEETITEIVPEEEFTEQSSEEDNYKTKIILKY